MILNYFEDNIIIVHFVFLIFSNQIYTALMSNRTSNAVEEFSSLSEYYIQKQHSKCQNLLQFLKETILFWYNILKDKLSRYCKHSGVGSKLRGGGARLIIGNLDNQKKPPQTNK